MKIIFFWIFLSFSIFSTSFACMPPSPSEIIVWTYEWKEDIIHPDENFREWRNIDFIKITDTKKPFWRNYSKLWKYYFLHSDNNDVNFDLSNYKKWDQIIILSDYNNWNYEEYFAVYKIWKLVRDINWELDIVDTKWLSKDWWKSMWWCWNYKDESVMNKEELLNWVAYTIDVWVPITNWNLSIIHYISWAFLIDKFIAWKWETYIWIWLLLQIIVFIFYWFLLYFLIKFFSKWKLNKKIIVPLIISFILLFLIYIFLFPWI